METTGLPESMRFPEPWFLILVVGGCMVAPYLLGVPPKTPKQRVYLAITIAFLAWVLPLMVPLR